MSRKGPPVPPKPNSDGQLKKLAPSTDSKLLRDSGISIEVTGVSKSEPEVSKRHVSGSQSVRMLAEQFAHIARTSGNAKTKPTVPAKPVQCFEKFNYLMICDENSVDNENIYDDVFVSDNDEGCYESTSFEELPISCHPTNAVEELLQNERKYVDRLKDYINTLIPVMYQNNLPAGLRFQKNNIFANIEAIHAMHRDEFLPALEQCGTDAKKIMHTIVEFIENDKFYCYVLYALNKHKSGRICDSNSDFLKNAQGDLDQFLLEPVQRLPRYKLLLNQILKDNAKFENRDAINGETAILCRAETILSRLIELVDAAVSLSDILPCPEPRSTESKTLNYHEDLPLALVLRPEQHKSAVQKDPINLLYQGKLRGCMDLEVYDYNERRKYSSKIFFFEKLILYTEIQKGKLEYRGHYFDSEVNYWEESRNKLLLFCKHRGNQDILVHSNNTDGMIYCVDKMREDFVHNQAKEFFSDKKHRGSVDVNKIIDTGQSSHEEQEFQNFDEHLSTLVTCQERFCHVLQANYNFYLASQSTDDLTITFHNNFRNMYSLHNHQILGDLSKSVDLLGICELFLSYLKSEVMPSIYYAYLKDFKRAIATVKIRRTAANFNNQVAPTVEDFAFLCIDHLEEYCRFFESATCQMSEDSSANIPIDMELFRQLAITQTELNKFAHNVRQNYKLYHLDDRSVDCGLVKYSEVTTLQTDGEGLYCRLFINERAVICVSIQVIVKEHDKNKENYVRIVFIDKFGGRGTPMRMRRSRKTDTRLNFVIDGVKYKVHFANQQDKERFYDKYIDHYVLVE
ncbi:uncharacterized protein LOC131437254 isoform X2 [Malaya genurostris]|uniref:uncharacterized protein LOC131437254 isoform X2 n=1 Tax=Malaya genurostris TaxID=325434 RepID=UPI0026F3A587|nr:uncharacterized protein LOC131437254 isoform X2 [Malaya genurostris]